MVADAVEIEPVSKANSTREIYREFCRIRPLAAIFVFIRRANSNGYSQIPYATEQGIFAAITGNFLQRTGNFALEKLEKQGIPFGTNIFAPNGCRSVGDHAPRSELTSTAWGRSRLWNNYARNVAGRQIE